MASWNRQGEMGWSRGICRWRPDERTLALSVPFTWLVNEAEVLARAHNGPVIAGGPGMELLYRDPDEGQECDWAELRAGTFYPTLAMHNPLACRTTRGCPNRCGFCAVPQLEGQFHELDLEPGWMPLPIICDDNILAASESHLAFVIKALRLCRYPSIDFNQGLDSRLFTKWHAALFAGLHEVGTKPILRFSFDHISVRPWIETAVEFALSAGFPRRRIRIYVLVGYDDTPADAHRRCALVREWGLKPNPMRYNPLDALERDTYVLANSGWTQGLLKDTIRYYSRDMFKSIPFEEYHGSGELPLLMIGG